jgi:hypothetical protein
MHFKKTTSLDWKRTQWLKLIIVIGLLSGFLLSVKLWGSDRFFPLAPVLEFLPPIPANWDYFIYGCFALLLIAIALARHPQRLLWIFLSLALAYGLWDQNRWQPWFYQYLWMLGALGFVNWEKSDSARQAEVLNIARLIVASLYIWSGIQKANIVFVQEIFPWLVNPFTQTWPDNVRQALNLWGYSIPLLEAAIGVGLLTQRFRTLFVALAVAMHLFILVCIGPWGHNANTVIWPWNLAMIAFVLLLFTKAETVTLKEILWTKKSLRHNLALLVFGIMPLFSFFNLWDSYFSAALYSGNISHAHIFIEEPLKERLPKSVWAFLRKPDSRAGYKLDFVSWSNQTLGVPPYPEARFYRQIARYLCNYATQPSHLLLVIEGKPNWISGRRQSSVYNCSSL